MANVKKNIAKEGGNPQGAWQKNQAAAITSHDLVGLGAQASHWSPQTAVISERKFLTAQKWLRPRQALVDDNEPSEYIFPELWPSRK
jgi:hypothetical protein